MTIILGDHGSLYYEDDGMDRKKRALSTLPGTVICIRGNHDHRPDCAAYCHELIQVDEPTYSGQFYMDKRFSNILYTREFGWYRFGSKRVFVIGGAFSVDKYRRISMQENGFTSYLWFSDEQLYPNERKTAQEQLMSDTNGEFYLMSHTCPFRYIPHNAFLPDVNQSTVDTTMEKWLDELESGLAYTKWYCGHYHIDKTVDDMRFLFNDLILFDKLMEDNHERVSQ